MGFDPQSYWFQLGSQVGSSNDIQGVSTQQHKSCDHDPCNTFSLTCTVVGVRGHTLSHPLRPRPTPTGRPRTRQQAGEFVTSGGSQSKAPCKVQRSKSFHLTCPDRRRQRRRNSQPQPRSVGRLVRGYVHLAPDEALATAGPAPSVVPTVSEALRAAASDASERVQPRCVLIS